MTRVKKVWAVMCGAYSDKYLAAVFTIQDNADAYARANDGYVEEDELDPPLDADSIRHLRPGEHVYSVSMNPDGNEAQAWETWKEQTAKRYLNCRVDHGDSVGRLAGGCWATSEQHAIKILNERRTMWLALGSPVGDVSAGQSGVYGWHDAKVSAEESADDER